MPRRADRLQGRGNRLLGQGVLRGGSAGTAAHGGIQAQRGGQDVVLIIEITVAHLARGVQAFDDLAVGVEHMAVSVGLHAADRAHRDGLDVERVVGAVADRDQGHLAHILVDARFGVITQTRRHTFLVSLLGIKHIVLAVNKMDLVDFDQKVFNDIVAEYRQLTDHLGIDDVTCFPLSAREGDNVVEKSDRTPWYDGPALLHFLETVPIHADRNFDDFRYPVQYVLRPDLNFRGFCGKVASGVVHVGDEVMALPSMKRSHVKAIVAPYSPPAGGNSSSLDAPHRGAEGGLAFPPQSVCLTLEDEIDISRGEMLVHPDNVPHIGRHFTTMLVWMDEEPMDTGKQFFLKHNTNTTRSTIAAIRNRVDVNTLEEKPGQPFVLNEIGQVDILTAKTLFFDAYTQNRQTGAFILIDPITNNTSAVGMILAPLDESALDNDLVPTLDLKRLGISEEHYAAIETAVKDLCRQGIEVKVIY